MKHDEVIKRVAKREAEPLLDIASQGAARTEEFPIDCSLLGDEYHSFDIRKSDKHKELFEKIGKLTGPVLYFFEVDSDITAEVIVSSIREYSATPEAKVVPAIKKNFPKSRVLYVGKVKKGFWGRVIQHLGYYKTASTQGLQLHYWAKHQNLQLRLTAMEFENSAADVMPLLEKELARELKPILGKHR